MTAQGHLAPQAKYIIHSIAEMHVPDPKSLERAAVITEMRDRLSFSLARSHAPFTANCVAIETNRLHRKAFHLIQPGRFISIQILPKLLKSKTPIHNLYIKCYLILTFHVFLLVMT